MKLGGASKTDLHGYDTSSDTGRAANGAVANGTSL